VLRLFVVPARLPVAPLQCRSRPDAIVIAPHRVRKVLCYTGYAAVYCTRPLPVRMPAQWTCCEADVAAMRPGARHVCCVRCVRCNHCAHARQGRLRARCVRPGARYAITPTVTGHPPVCTCLNRTCLPCSMPHALLLSLCSMFLCSMFYVMFYAL
jgi:hypothetical protein